MSLIGDALRKARQEAADRESDRKGILFSAKITDSPSRSNLGLGLALGALIAVIATVAGGAAVWWVLGLGDTDQNQRPRSGESAATAAVVDPDPDEPASVPAVSDSARGNDSEQDQGQRSAAASPPTIERDPDGIGASVGGSSSDTGIDRATQDPTTPRPQDLETSSSATGFVGTEDGEAIFILEADLGNGVNLSLGYLIFREEDPFAEINGIELHLGGTIEGFRVKGITRDRVTLSNGRRTIVLKAP